MATLLITYDLNSPGQNYEAVYDTIKAMGDWNHPLDSTWFVKTNLTTDQAHQRIKAVTDAGDHWFISVVTQDRQGWMPKSFWDWLR
ncbi:MULTISPECIES: hypothetical protein [unclassified Dietzia]|uniref:hypothetical protein n=1 Tax=unclassified Dietzia TaxID=2617939 RepID=UPI0015FE6B33|nr:MULTISPECIES: hypothetical protein [unclassified Dietzia]MBB1024919.1 hypothetical protein [Dietzia sp. DQ12-76]